MIGVLIPAHNEAGSIASCLASIAKAAAHPCLDEEVLVVVAIDRCSDATESIAACAGAAVIAVPEPFGVGVARAVAATFAIERGATWLAMTDADSRVPTDWLVAQKRLGVDAFCGLVEVDDWEGYAAEVVSAFQSCQLQQDGHSRVHGANLGVSADFYKRCGGFSSLQCGEDVAFVDALVNIQARIARLATPIVWTSARREARAHGGFSDFLKKLELVTARAGHPGIDVTTGLIEHSGYS